MWNNAIGDDGITTIAGSLSNSTSSIIELGVSWCGISFVGVRSLAESLLNNQNIRKLWLYGNLITVDGARLIIESAVNNRVCEYVGISDEYKGDDEVKRMKAILDDRAHRSRQNVRKYMMLYNVINMIMITDKCE